MKERPILFNGADSWTANPWVWVPTFDVVYGGGLC